MIISSSFRSDLCFCDLCSSSIIFFTFLLTWRFLCHHSLQSSFVILMIFKPISLRRNSFWPDVHNCHIWRLVWNHSQKWKSHCGIQSLVVEGPQFWGRSSKWRFCCVERVVSVWTLLLVWFYQAQWEELLKTWLELLEVVLVGWLWEFWQLNIWLLFVFLF